MNTVPKSPARECPSFGLIQVTVVSRLLLVLAVIAAGVAIEPRPALAQEAPGLSGLLKKLIRGGQKPRESRRKSATKTNRVVRSSEPKVEIPDKLENARTVLVIGDFMASGLAEGLERAFEMSPGVRIIDAANGSSGLVRDDYHDWNAAAPELITEYKPAVVTIMIGANDRQQMKVGLTRLDVRSEGWLEEYKKRANTLARHFAGAGIPVVWVGMVPFKSQKATSDILAFNDIYRSAAEAAKGDFVDIWDGFVDADGNFTTRGPDINGQIARLRTGDGINVGKAGRRLLAFYTEKPLRKYLGDATAPDIAILGPENLPKLTLDPLTPAATIERTKPMRLDDPELDGGVALLGGGNEPHSLAPRTPAETLAIEGIAPPAQPGRVDYFGPPLVEEPDRQPTAAIGTLEEPGLQPGGQTTE